MNHRHDPEAQPDYAQEHDEADAKRLRKQHRAKSQKRRHVSHEHRKGAYKMLKRPPRLPGESSEQHTARRKSNAAKFGKLARGNG